MRITDKHHKMPRSVRVVFAMMMREMATSYGRSFLGYLWAVIEPIGAIAVLSLAFSLILRSPALGDNFPLFYASGFLPFTVYHSVQTSLTLAIASNKQLLFYPEVSYIDAMLGRFILTMITQILVAIIIFVGIKVMFDLRLNIDLPDIALSLLLAGLLGLGIGALNAVLIYLAPSWRHIWSIINRPLFLASCIFYLFDSLPLWAQDILWYNPLVHVVALMRNGFYPIHDGSYISIMYPLLISGLCLLLALVLLRRFSKDMINL